MNLERNILGFCEKLGEIRNKINDKDGFSHRPKIISHPLKESTMEDLIFVYQIIILRTKKIFNFTSHSLFENSIYNPYKLKIIKF